MLEYSQEHDTESWAHKVKAHKDFHLVAAEQVVLKNSNHMPKRNLPPDSTRIREMKYFKDKYVQFFKIIENLDISRFNFMQTQNLTRYILQYSELLNEGT